jgi:hypothetical protein
MFANIGPYYRAKRMAEEEEEDRVDTLVQFQPIKVGDEIKDNIGTYVVQDLIRHNGRVLIMVQCTGSLDIGLIGRVGYKSMHDVLSKCWRPSLR